GHRVIVSKGNDRRTSVPPADIAGTGRALACSDFQIPHGTRLPRAGSRRDRTGRIAGSVVTDNDLIRLGGKRLALQRGQTPRQKIGAAIRRYDHAHARPHRLIRSAHARFSTRKLPITSASIGDVQNDSNASRGLHTTGSPRVLNEVFTSTGTPVSASN